MIRKSKILLAWILAAVILVFFFLIYTNKQGKDFTRTKPEPDTIVVQPGPGQGIVQAQMRNVNFRINPDIILMIKKLRGELIASNKNKYPVFDKKDSYVLNIFNAVISIDVESLSNLLNRYVFNGTSIKDLKISVEGNFLKQEGKIKGIPFSAKSTISVTSDGKIKLHSEDMKALGIEVGGLMNLFNIELAQLVKLRKNSGAEIQGNDFLLDPSKMLPPPEIRGHLSSVEIGKGYITQIFSGKKVPELHPDSSANNYMFYYGGRLGFGNLTMYKADMLIIDKDQKDPFDFFLDHYFDQLTAGYHITTKEDGLIIYMPDYGKLSSKR